jgi:ABC-2 type transport system permease protein
MSVDVTGGGPAGQGGGRNSVIHDIGYQRYTGPRLGRSYAVRSLYSHGVRTAFGLGRSAKAKVFPWIVVGLVFLVATVLTVVRSQSGEQVVSYWEFPGPITLLIILFCAVVAPELVSRDLRGGVLPLYFSRPLTRSDYALAKLAALMSAVFALLAGPELLMFIGGAFTLDGMGPVWHEFVDLTRGLAVVCVYAAVFGALSLLVASLAGRRAVAAAMVVALFLITTPIYGVLMGLAYSGSEGELTGARLSTAQLAGLVNPGTLVGGISQWWFGGEGQSVGPYGWVYGLVALGLVVVSVALLLLRYRKVAR